MTSPGPIGQMLLQAGYIDGWQLQSALADQRRWGGRIGEALVRLGFVSEPVLLNELARQHGVPYVEIGERYVPPAVVRLLPEKLVRARRIFPIAYAPQPGRGLLVVATSQPQDLTALDEAAFASGLKVKAALAGERDIERAIERHLGGARPADEAWRGAVARPARSLARNAA